MFKEKLKDKYRSLFSTQIVYRGIDYFKNNKVVKVYKNEEAKQYIAKVEGSSYNLYYDVEIEISDEKINMNCTCPCIDNCKHEYATLMAIDEKKYSSIKLLPIPEEKEISIEKFVNAIPEDKIRKYLINKFEFDEVIEEEEFKEAFSCYLPEASREYFYNTLFNQFQLGVVNINKFLSLAKLSLENEKYEYVFKICSAIIDASKDTKYNDVNEILLNGYSKIGTFLRISYRKGNKNLKNKMDQWIKNYENQNYYNDIYLEDMIIWIR